MRVEKQVAGGEGGRYAGGLLHLFDWNMKSRKKFTGTPDLSEQSKQKRISDKNNPITQFHPSNGDMAGRLIHKDCGFSLIDEDDYGKSPGVVARLMGLDSFPTSSFSDTHSNRFVDSRYVRKSLEETEQKDTHQIDRKLKVIEKFQTEFLPKNSARSVPTTPIKNSRFVSYDDPLPSSRKPSCRRPVESNAARNLKGQSMTKSWDGCLDRKPFPEEGKKSVSLAIQAKINVKKREGLSTVKKPSTNSVLKQNNQKQNGLKERGKSAAKTPAPSINSQRRKPVPGKSASKIPANSLNKNVDQRKRSSGRVVKSNGSDIVSFTFTSPMSGTPTKSREKTNVFLSDNHGKNTGNRNGLNLATNDDSITAKISASIYRDSSTTYRAQINRTLFFQGKKNPDRIHKDNSSSEFSSNGQASINPMFKRQELVTVFSKKPTSMEFDTESEPSYINNILSDIESMFTDFFIGRTHKIMNPRLFDQLEAQRSILGKKKNETKLRRKLVFDCVSECVDSRCRVWPRGLAAVRRKDRLAMEVCNKISGWERMKDCMVDELVDEDMSSDQRQKWLDFDVEVFELGVEIERRLLDYLINEALVDILVHCRYD